MDGKVSDFGQIASLHRYTLTEGRGKGLDVIDCNNGKLRFLLNTNKACDIMQLYHKGQNVSFISKNGFTQRNAPFSKRFEGGMLYTCGLDSVGDRKGYELHGTLHNLPAEIIRTVCDENGIVVKAVIRDTSLFGKNLVLKRKIFSGIGTEFISLEDTLINEGFNDEKYCLLYHINIGYPMLDEGAKIIADVKKCSPRTSWAKENKDSVYDITSPVPNQEETCYFLELNTPKITLSNKKTGKELTVSYSGDTLPRFVEWKSMSSGDYALGFEPCTTELDDNFVYKTIKPCEKTEFNINISVKSFQD